MWTEEELLSVLARHHRHHHRHDHHDDGCSSSASSASAAADWLQARWTQHVRPAMRRIAADIAATVLPAWTADNRAGSGNGGGVATGETSNSWAGRDAGRGAAAVAPRGEPHAEPQPAARAERDAPPPHRPHAEAGHHDGPHFRGARAAAASMAWKGAARAWRKRVEGIMGGQQKGVVGK